MSTVIAICASTVAHAQRDDAMAARRLFAEATEHYQENRYAEAIQLLERAYALDPVPELLLNLSVAAERHGDLDRAIDAVSHYLDLAPADEEASVRARARLSRLREDRERLDGALEGPPDSVGPVEPTTGGDAEQVASVRLRPDDESSETPTEPSAPETPSDNADPPLSRSSWPWTLGVAGAVSVGTGVATGVVALRRAHSAQSAPNQAAAWNLRRDAEAYATASTVAFAVGCALLASGIIMAIVRGVRRREIAERSMSPLRIHF